MSAGSSLGPLVGYLQQLAVQSTHAGANDRQLLERFARDRDEEAFRTLVARHGALVLGVCRRALRHRQDAEDCFQATFLVLARRAGAVRWHDSIAGWLHQAATRLAADIRVRTARRQRREAQAAGQRTAVENATTVSDVGAVLDEEMRCLPERLRTPFLMCCLDGRTRDEAARRLGLSLRTLERRLQTARGLLRARLARRGLTLSAALAAWGLVQETVRAVPSSVCTAAAQAAVRFAAGDLATVPARAAFLATRALRALLWERLRIAVLLAMVTGLLGVGAALWPTAAAVGSQQPMPAPADERAKRPADDRKLREASTAAAIDEGLRWLVRHQTAAGGWKLDAGPPNDVAATAFGLLPLLGAAEDDEPAKRFGPHAEAVRRGLAFLARMQKDNGDYGGGMYAHALATWALCDGYRLTGDAKLKQPARRALDYIIAAQHDGGGWRYAPRQVGDTSVTSWHIVALKRGEKAGLTVPAEVFKKASAYLDGAASDGGTGYGYVAGTPATPTMTAAGLLCRRLLGWDARDPTLLKGAARLQAVPPTPTTVNSYYYHYATRVMREVGGKEWAAWESAMAQLLLQRQEREGGERGSWSPARDVYAAAGGRLMISSLSLLTLENCGQLSRPAVGAGGRVTEGEAVRCWVDLGGGDFAQVKHAIERLAADPRQAVRLVRARLQPAVPPDAKRLARLIDGLGSDAFATRDAAYRELSALGEPAETAMRRAYKTASSLEQRRRLERLLDDIDRGSAASSWLRQLRALQILELAGTDDARQLLRTLADGAPGARLTRAAQAALDRLDKSHK